MLVAAGCCAGAYLQLLALLATALVALLLAREGVARCMVRGLY